MNALGWLIFCILILMLINHGEALKITLDGKEHYVKIDLTDKIKGEKR